MSICSDVWITKDEAKKAVVEKLIYENRILIKLAVESMNTFELSGYLNDSDIYYYNIEDDGTEEEE